MHAYIKWIGPEVITQPNEKKDVIEGPPYFCVCLNCRCYIRVNVSLLQFLKNILEYLNTFGAATLCPYFK